MLKKIKSQENVIMIFFVVTLFAVGLYIILGREFIDIIYFGIILYYFCKFLRIRKSGK